MPAATEAPTEGQPKGTVIHPNSSVTWEQIWAENDPEKARRMWMDELVGMGGVNPKVPMRYFSDFNGKFAREWTDQHSKYATQQSTDALGGGLEAFTPFLAAAGLGAGAITADIGLTFAEMMTGNEIKYDVEVSTDSMINKIRHMLGDKAFSVEERAGEGNSDRIIEISEKKQLYMRSSRDEQPPLVQVLVGYAEIEETVIDLKKAYDPDEHRKPKQMRKVTNVSISKLQGDTLLSKGFDVAGTLFAALSSEDGAAHLFEKGAELIADGKEVFDIVTLKKTVTAAIVAVANEADEVRQTMIRNINENNSNYAKALKASCECGNCGANRKGIAEGLCAQCGATLDEAGYTDVPDLEKRIAQAGFVI